MHIMIPHKSRHHPEITLSSQTVSIGSMYTLAKLATADINIHIINTSAGRKEIY